MARRLKFSTAPYTLSDVPLGSLVPDIRHPNQDAVSVLKAKLGIDYSPRNQQNFKGLLDTTSNSTLRAQITRLLSLLRSKSKSQSLEIEAESGTIYELKEPRTFFRLACAEPKVRTWLQEGLQEKAESNFVVGLRTFHNASVGHKARQESQTKVEGSVPVGQSIKANTSVDVSDAADVSFGRDKDKAKESDESFTTPGEYIYAICFRRVVLQTMSISDAVLDSEDEWRLYSEREGDPTSRQAEICKADLEDEDFVGLDAAIAFTNNGEEYYTY